MPRASGSERRGLSRPCLPSGAAWRAHVRDVGIELRGRLGPWCNGQAKVLQAILDELEDGAKIGDERSVAAIGAACGPRIGERMTREHLHALEAKGFIVCVLQGGRRTPGQKGWLTSAYVVPALLPHVGALRGEAAKRARSLLDRPRVAAALDAAPILAIAPTRPKPLIGRVSAPSAFDPDPDLSGSTTATGSAPSTASRACARVSELEADTSAGGAVAPSPPIATPPCDPPPAPGDFTARMAALRRRVLPPAEPHPAPPSPPAPVTAPDSPPAPEPAPAATQGPGAAGQRREVSATRLPELGRHMTGREALAEVQRQNPHLSRSKAWAVVVKAQASFREGIVTLPGRRRGPRGGGAP